MIALSIPHKAVSSHGPTGWRCEYCGVGLHLGNQHKACPDRARAERDKRIQVEAPNMVALLRQLARHASGNPSQPMPDVAVGEIVMILGRIDGGAA